jgi:hypothetical protein
MEGDPSPTTEERSGVYALHGSRTDTSGRVQPAGPRRAYRYVLAAVLVVVLPVAGFWLGKADVGHRTASGELSEAGVHATASTSSAGENASVYGSDEVMARLPQLLEHPFFASTEPTDRAYRIDCAHVSAFVRTATGQCAAGGPREIAVATSAPMFSTDDGIGSQAYAKTSVLLAEAENARTTLFAAVRTLLAGRLTDESAAAVRGSMVGGVDHAQYLSALREEQSRLERAENAWVAVRESMCEAEKAVVPPDALGGDDAARFAYLNCLVVETRHRADYLGDLAAWLESTTSERPGT